MNNIIINVFLEQIFFDQVDVFPRIRVQLLQYTIALKKKKLKTLQNCTNYNSDIVL